MSSSSAPSDSAKAASSTPPVAGAVPPAAAPKKRAKRAPAADGATPPTAKRPKKAEVAADGSAPPKKTSSRKKAKETEEQEDQVVEQSEQNRRLAQIEAEEQEMKSKDQDEENDADTWKDSAFKQSTDSIKLYDEKLKVLYSKMTAEQQERYSKFRSSGISENEFADEVMKPLGLQASAETCTVMRAIGKMFIGELVDTAISVMQEWGDQGPIRPVHLREAYRRIEASGSIPTAPTSLKFGHMR
jgi:transcription initiation factor TFIID subunit 11